LTNLSRIKIKAIIFDMDGVLIDSEPVHKLAKQQTFAQFGVTLPDSIYEQYKGRPDEAMMNELVPTLPGLEAGAQEILEIKRLEFEALEHLATPITGAQEFVHWAKNKFQIALATSSTTRNRLAALRTLGLTDTFGFVVDASGFTRSKPHPEVFEKAIRGLNAEPSECLVIEDSLNGVIAGKAAGCHVAAITTSFSKEQLLSHGADYVVQSFKELRELLDKIIG
jgi:beta-phosphoglucomutase